MVTIPNIYALKTTITTRVNDVAAEVADSVVVVIVISAAASLPGWALTAAVILEDWPLKLLLQMQREPVDLLGQDDGARVEQFYLAVSLVLAVTYLRDLWQTLNHFIFETREEDVCDKVYQRDTLVNPLSVVLQQVGEAGKRIEFDIGLNPAIFLTDRWLYFFVHEIYYVIDMWLKDWNVGSHWKPPQRDEALSAVLTFGLCDVLLDLFDDLGEPARMLVVLNKRAVQLRDQFNAFLLDQSRFWLAQHSLYFIDYSFVLAILMFALDDLLTNTFLRN